MSAPVVPQPAGLCARCRHGRALRSDRGSLFVLCGLAASDASFPKYPPLPVLACRGFETSSPPREI